MTDIDASQFVHQQDLKEVYAETDLLQREAMICSITAYRSPNKLDLGDAIPHLQLASLTGQQKLDLYDLAQERPLVLFFGSYT